MLVALDRLRQRRHRERKVAHLSEMKTTSGDRDPLADALPLLDDAIDRLNSHDREVLMLHFAERLTFVQIATRLGSTADAVRMRTNRALAVLAASLRKTGVVV